SPHPTSRASPAPCPMNARNDSRYAQNASWFGARAHAVHSDAIRDQCSMSLRLRDIGAPPRCSARENLQLIRVGSERIASIGLVSFSALFPPQSQQARKICHSDWEVSVEPLGGFRVGGVGYGADFE